MTVNSILDSLVEKNQGYLKTADVVSVGVSKVALAEYVRKNGLTRVAHGLYATHDAWRDDFYVLQMRYPQAIFSHETALYLLGLAEREPIQYSLTLKTEMSASRLSKEGIKVYKVKEELFDIGLSELRSPTGHLVRSYDAERTICDLLRSRSTVEIQDIQSALKGYVRRSDRNIPLLMRYAKLFSIDKRLGQYLEVLL